MVMKLAISLTNGSANLISVIEPIKEIFGRISSNFIILKTIPSDISFGIKCIFEMLPMQCPHQQNSNY